MYEPRTYREYVKADDLIKFEVIEKESDLLILADTNLYDKAMLALLRCRADLEKYIIEQHEFATTLKPYRVSLAASQIIKDMAGAAKKVGVGPMAAVAGVIAEYVGHELLKYGKEVIVENGGDIFLKINKTRRIGVYAGNSPFSEKIALEIDPKDTPCGVCTSSGTVGHSLSFGKADAVCVITKSTALADAAATAIGNVVQDVKTVQDGLNLSKKIRGLLGVLIIKDDQMGILGKIKISPI